MLTLSKIIPQGLGLAAALLKRAATVELDWDVRQKSRFDASDSQGRALGVFLPRGSVVRGGDVLVAEDGSLFRVLAAAQPVLRITHCPHHGSAFDLLRAAYHLGNRHVPIELRPAYLQIEPDPVLADMLRRMHLDVVAMDAPFEPEGGAYGGHGHGHAHEHGHDQAAPAETATGHGPARGHHHHGEDGGHDHGHDHTHGHSHGPAHDHGAHGHHHTHGPGCGHHHDH